MALFDFLKRKKNIEKAREKSSDKTKDKPKKVAKVLDAGVKIEVEKKIKPTRIIKSNSFSYNIVKESHISEKSTYLGASNKYIFRVYNDSKKPDIKKAVEGIYNVDVLDVNVIKIPKKKRRIGRTEGFKKGYKKAIVTIKEGQKIETF